MFILIMLALAFIIFILNKFDRIAKKRYRQDAYDLLETENPDPKKLKDTIKGLRLYGGRFRRDKEFSQLVSQLQDKLDLIEGKLDPLLKR